RFRDMIPRESLSFFFAYQTIRQKYRISGLLIWLKMLFCRSKNVVRNGLRGRTQRYKCKDCGRRFDGGIRCDKAKVISDYVEGKQTLE
ncbi:IS1/IS1595 family N-terminal zinc-binding domain-containing protein, partial [Bacteroides acidifaciens]|uniref:IS1/IS1595 family N-terminal zinc-binding domain-containing protein n=1 Tax=Bacteroides acidifaciens TaxID=85831 RepID=UPI003DA4328C